MRLQFSHCVATVNVILVNKSLSAWSIFQSSRTSQPSWTPFDGAVDGARHCGESSTFIEELTPSLISFYFKFTYLLYDVMSAESRLQCRRSKHPNRAVSIQHRKPQANIKTDSMKPFAPFTQKRYEKYLFKSPISVFASGQNIGCSSAHHLFNNDGDTECMWLNNSTKYNE